MNKDLDERLVKNGQYRDANNIEVATTEGGDVGVVQSLKGNTAIADVGSTKTFAGGVCIGSYSDEKNNCAYWFVTTNSTWDTSAPLASSPVQTFRDVIYKTTHSASSDDIEPVFVDFWLEKHANPTDSSSGDDAWVGSGPYTGVILTSAANLTVGMWIKFVTSGGGVVRKIASISTNTITFDESISVNTANHLEFTWEVPEVYGNYAYSTNDFKNRILRFDADYLITGINVIDNLLFWTDNNSEPKKINVTRCILGTTNINTTTKINIDQTSYGFYKEKDVSVIKQSPKTAPILEMVQTTRTNTVNSFSFDFAGINEGDEITLQTSLVEHHYKSNDIIILAEDPTLPIPQDFKVKCRVKTATSTTITVFVETLNNPTTGSSIVFNSELLDDNKPLFDDKLVRFCTRWKYTDGEYSTFSPFSVPAFLPSTFQYNTKECFNLGMVNSLKELIIKDFIPVDISKEISQVDILYKESDSPVIYYVDTVKESDTVLNNQKQPWATINNSLLFQGNYKIDAESVYSALPSNQILRPWDAVPRKAKAQEIVGNRIVYGNYTQNYNLESSSSKPLFQSFLKGRQDAEIEMLLNPHVDPINLSTGDSAEGWSFNTGSGGWKLVDYYEYWYLGGGFEHHTTSVANYKRIWQNLNIEDDATYLVSFEVSDYVEGEVRGPYLVGPSKSTNSPAFHAHSNGIYEKKISVSDSSNYTSGGFNALYAAGKTCFWQAKNYQGKEFKGTIKNFSIKKASNQKRFESIKSQRTYQLGVVYSDAKGRQTPVLTSSTGSFKVPKLESEKNNSINVKLNNAPPSFADYFKYYIKDLSSPYYNLAVSRIYKAKDSNVWVSFPSSERNKIDEESYLILKKGFKTGAVLDEEATYKVIAIENEASEYIKTTRDPIVIITQDDTSANNLGTDYFDQILYRPIQDSIVLAIKKSTWENNGNGPDLTNINFDISLKFYSDTNQSIWYDIVTVSEREMNSESYYFLNLNNGITEGDSSWILNSSNVFESGVKMQMVKSTIDNKPEFDGVFFVKILLDDSITQNLLSGISITIGDWGVRARSDLWYLSDGNRGAIDGTNDVAIALLGNTGTDIRTTWDNAGNPQDGNFFEISGSSGKDISEISSYSPSMGAVYTDGLNGNVYFRGSEDAYIKWTRLLKLTLWNGWDLDDGNTNTRKGFFIDKSSYIGIQPDGNNDPTLGEYYQNRSDGSTITNVEQGNFLDHNMLLGKNTLPTNIKFGKGIWQSNGGETLFDGLTPDPFFISGKYYMELSFAKISANSSAHNLTASQVNDPQNWQDAWSVGSVSNTQQVQFQDFVDRLVLGSLFRFIEDPDGTIYRIRNVKTEKRYNHTPYPFSNAMIANFGGLYNYTGAVSPRHITWGDLPFTCNNTGGNSYQYPSFDYQGKKLIKDSSSDFYAGNGKYPPGTIIQDSLGIEKTLFGKATNRRLTWILELSALPGSGGNYNPVNDSPTVGATTQSSHNISQFIEFVDDISEDSGQLLSDSPAIFETKAKENEGLDIYYEASDYISVAKHELTQQLSWFNCYSFQNGVESIRIKDDFNEVFLDKQVIVSTTLQGDYKENHRKYGLVYSGVYNSSSGINNLNQFIAAETITKDINPNYGSIQKLYARNSDLMVFCEDKVLKILSQKDALYSADGDVNLIATNKFLGQVIPFVGDYGISKNPESFSSDNYRTYFTDKQRGAVLRLSRDGITPISDAGMQTWFKDNLKNSTSVLGSFDTNKKEYNVTVKKAVDADYTLSYSEYVKGWSSFKTFIPEEALSVENEYFSIANADATTNNKIWKHHTNSSYNNFYAKTPTTTEQSSVTVILNDEPSIVKNFMTLNYEGTQSKIHQNYADTNNYYNIGAADIEGWYAETITTDKQTGSLNEFIEKEGKWFNFIKGDTTYYTSASDNNLDTEEFTVQGLGKITAHDTLS